jgi:hypothetical protein
MIDTRNAKPVGDEPSRAIGHHPGAYRRFHTALYTRTYSDDMRLPNVLPLSGPQLT